MGKSSPLPPCTPACAVKEEKMARKDQIPVGFDEKTSQIIRTFARRTGNSLSITISKIVKKYIEQNNLEALLAKEEN